MYGAAKQLFSQRKEVYVMKKYLIYSIIPAALAFGAPNAIAKEIGHDNCGGTQTVEVPGMGNVNEAALQRHIDETQARLNRHATRGYWPTARNAKSHLESMQRAMIRLHDQMVNTGCAGAVHGASLKTRISVLEERATK